MDAAEEAFLELGFSNATMDDIAARAGASKATFYKHFGSKEALLAEIVHSRIPDITEPTARAGGNDGRLQALLVEWGLQILRRVSAPRAMALYRLILAELPRAPELGRIFYEQGPVTFQRQLAALLRRATAEGQLDCRNPELAAMQLNSLIFGDSFGWAIVGQVEKPWDERRAREHVGEAVTTFLARYGA